MQIQIIDDNANLAEGRLSAYRRRFSEVDSERLMYLDSISRHYSVRHCGEEIAGFRLTDLSAMNTEIQQLFPHHAFMTPAYEWGRFWVSESHQQKGYGYLASIAAFDFFKKNNCRVYFKTSRGLGNIAVSLGAKDENSSTFNYRLGYECHLYRFDAE